MKRILFIGHDASQTGAPIVLLSLVRWMRNRRSDVSIDILLLNGGELESEYCAVADDFVIPSKPGNTLLDRVWRRLFRGRRQATDPDLFRSPYDVVLGNTIVSLPYLTTFKNRGVRTVCWIHELTYVIDSFFEREKFLELSRNVELFVCGSKAVASNLTQIGVSQPLTVIYEPAPPPPLDAEVTSSADVKRELGIPEDAFVVGGGGTVEWRKGTDLFLQIASKISRTEHSMYFVWVGDAPETRAEEMRRVLHDRTMLKLEDRVTFTGFTTKPGRYLSIIDAFALTSREDPFPIMCLDAASLGKPIVCFQSVGGMPEFVEADAGSAVPYCDIDAFAERLLEYFRDRRSLQTDGERARTKLRTVFPAEHSLELLETVLMDGI